MSRLTTNRSIEVFEESLGRRTTNIAKKLGVTVDPTIPPGEIIGDLIETAATQSGQKVAILIDEYDAPFVALMNDPHKLKLLREFLSIYYAQMKAVDDYISFIFVTGITKFAHLGLLSAFNSYTDISTNPEFGAIVGFTHEELKHYFRDYLKQTASVLKMTEKKLSEQMKEYYNGFCFDGVTKVYNPFSTKQFFDEKDFHQFWFTSGTSTILANFLKNNRLTVEEFRGMPISKNEARDPGEFSRAKPWNFLYQTGYLTLCPGRKKGTYSLDYPNLEVLEAISKLLIENFFEESKIGKSLDTVYSDLDDALMNHDIEKFIEILNILYATIPYDDFEQAKQRQKIVFKKVGLEFDFGHFLYRSTMLAFFHGAGINAIAEHHGNNGRSDAEIKHKGQIWVIEIKITTKKGDDEKVAEEALEQIKAKCYGKKFKDAVLLGVAVSDEERAIVTWKDSLHVKDKQKSKDKKNSNDGNRPTFRP
jgi:hypothetical protein